MIVSQDDKNLYQKIQDYGCGILSGCFLTGRDWSAEEVNSLYDILLAAKAIDKDCTITWTPFADILQLHFKMIAGPLYKLTDNELSIDQWFNEDSGHKHFVVGGKLSTEVVYDPFHCGSQTVKHGRPIGRRVFTK